MRFQVPQFTDIQDRIIGPLTLKQFMLYLAAVLVNIPIYLLSDMSLFLTLALPIMGIAALFAHFRLHGKTLEEVVMNAIRFYTQGQMFIWRRGDDEKLITIKDAVWREEVTPLVHGRVTTSLTNMAQALETQGKIVNQDAQDVLA